MTWFEHRKNWPWSSWSLYLDHQFEKKRKNGQFEEGKMRKETKQLSVWLKYNFWHWRRHEARENDTLYQKHCIKLVLLCVKLAMMMAWKRGGNGLNGGFTLLILPSFFDTSFIFFWYFLPSNIWLFPDFFLFHNSWYFQYFWYIFPILDTSKNVS